MGLLFILFALDQPMLAGVCNSRIQALWASPQLVEFSVTINLSESVQNWAQFV